MPNRDCYLTDKSTQLFKCYLLLYIFMHVIRDIKIKTSGMLDKFFTYEWYPQTLFQAFTKFWKGHILGNLILRCVMFAYAVNI